MIRSMIRSMMLLENSNPTDDPISAFLRDKYIKDQIQQYGRFDKSGTLIRYSLWTSLMNDEHYTRIALDVLDSGVVISTIWLGVYYTMFETMVFKNHEEEYAEKYDTEEEAIAGHKRAVARLNKEV